jgi:integrase
LRVQYLGKRRDIGLGAVDTTTRRADDPIHDVPLLQRKTLTLAEARDKSAMLRKLAQAGLDPVEERDRTRVIIPTFKEAMLKAHTALAEGWSDKNAAAFKSSLEEHIVPKLGSKRVDQITTADVIAALAPTWTEKPAQAQKLRVRLLQVLSFSKANGWRKEALPDPRELRDGLAKRRKGGNFAAMPYQDVPAFVADQLGKEDTKGRLALLFAIFTAARSGEVRSARWEHIDLDGKAWNRPADLMKGGVKHTVTLNEAAIDILKRARAISPGPGLIFPGKRSDVQLSDMTLSKVLRTAKRTETVHGFRSSFRDWAAEMMPTVPAMVAEMALAHAVGNKTEQAYLRSDLRDMRRTLMAAWGGYAAGTPAANVTPIRAAAAG